MRYHSFLIISIFLFNNNTSCNDGFPLITDSGLSFCDCTLRLFKLYVCCTIFLWNQCCCRIRGTVSDFYHYFCRTGKRFWQKVTDIRDRELVMINFLVVLQTYRIGRRINTSYIHRFSKCHSKTFPLPHCILPNSFVLP